MALEDALQANTAAILALTAQLKGGAAAAPAATGKPAGKAAVSKGPKNTPETVAAAAARVKAELSKEAAVYLIANVGKAEKLAQIQPSEYDAFVAACEKAIEAGEVEGMEADDM
jgi:hypothetical protein